MCTLIQTLFGQSQKVNDCNFCDLTIIYVLLLPQLIITRLNCYFSFDAKQPSGFFMK